MKHAKAGPNGTGKALPAATDGATPSFEELQRSHDLVQALLSALPPGEETELMELLQTLAGESGSRIEMNAARRKALKIVSHACKPVSAHEEDEAHGAGAGGDRKRVPRAGERRRGDRRRE